MSTTSPLSPLVGLTGSVNTPPSPILELTGIVKTFPGVRALDEAGLRVYHLTIPSYERGVARLLRYDRHP